MRVKILSLMAATAFLLLPASSKLAADDQPKHHAAGPAPDCPYGYFDFAPYDCAPYGYYGPSWFQNGEFIGIGPWFHGPEHFHGQVDDHFNPHYGYKGSLPRHGERPDQQHPVDKIQNFRATDERDGKGNEYREHSH